MNRTTGLSFLLLITSHLLDGQNYTEILGRPTKNSVTVSILFDQQAEVYWEYGKSSGNYPSRTETQVTKTDSATETDFVNLLPDTKYYYRTRYRISGTSQSFLEGPEHTFHTQRARGSAFSFAIEADPHLDTNSNTPAYSLTLQNILSQHPDFLIDLGDIFLSDKMSLQNQTNVTNRHLLYRPFYGATCHSVPLYLVIGNHEGENGWRLNGTPDCLPVMATNTRKLYYPNPYPNSFYTGNTKLENYVGLREDYYSWEWGDALFIVLDPYWYTTAKPDWGWTLGKDQYDWYKNVITTSQARFKFIFCHQLVGGKGNDGRGGSEFAGFFENGGENPDSTWGFDTYRAGWGKPIHALMVQNNPAIYFHGHDHCYAKQDKDGVVYQEVPQPSSRNISNITGTQYGYKDGIIMPSRGYLLVTVTDSTAKVDYIRTFLPNEETGGHTNGEIAYSYTIRSSASSVEEKNNGIGSFQLEQNYPNPFYFETKIRYRLTTTEMVTIKVLDILGRETKAVVNQYQQPGSYSITLNSGEVFPTRGMYYCRMTVGNASKTLKMVCIK